MLRTRPKKPCVNGEKIKRSDPRDPRFDYVALASDRLHVVCKLDNGMLYELPVTTFSIAEEFDGSTPVSALVVEHGTAAILRFKSGVELDFPVDFVLHHCEPSYAFFKGKISGLNSIGRNIRGIREAKKLTLAALSRKSGIAPPNLSRLENGKHRPSLNTLQILAKALGVQPSALLSRPRHVEQTKKFNAQPHFVSRKKMPA